LEAYFAQGLPLLPRPVNAVQFGGTTSGKQFTSGDSKSLNLIYMVNLLAQPLLALSYAKSE